MRDKLAKLIFDCWLDHTSNANGSAPSAAQYADYLIAHGVTFATDNNVPCKWIPVTERLPEKGGLYLVCKDFDIWGREDKVIAIEQYVEMWDGWYIDGCKITNITHWMPLPKTPEI